MHANKRTRQWLARDVEHESYTYTGLVDNIIQMMTQSDGWSSANVKSLIFIPLKVKRLIRFFHKQIGSLTSMLGSNSIESNTLNRR